MCPILAGDCDRASSPKAAALLTKPHDKLAPTHLQYTSRNSAAAYGGLGSVGTGTGERLFKAGICSWLLGAGTVQPAGAGSVGL